MIAFLKRLSGYCLTGLTREHKFGFFHGPGGNGKGVYLNALKAVMGEYAIAAPMEMFLLSKFERHPTEIAQLKGVRLVIAQEPQKGRRWDETKLKTLTSSDPLRGRFMRQDLFGFDPTHKLMLAANYKPSLYAVNEAIRRRLMLILFRAVIANPDPEFGEKLVPEYPAILRWMVDGCVEWQRSGLMVPESVVAASEQYFVNEDDIEQWLDDCVDRSDPRAFTTTRVLYTSRKKWCEARGLSPSSAKADLANPDPPSRTLQGSTSESYGGQPACRSRPSRARRRSPSSSTASPRRSTSCAILATTVVTDSGFSCARFARGRSSICICRARASS